jgi:hypothetical protein
MSVPPDPVRSFDILRSVNRVVVARSAHEIPDRPPLRLEVGDRVTVGERDREWPAFVFVTSRNGSGWVPERHLDRRGTSGVVTEEYDTTELPTREGEQLEVLREDVASGWLWCRADDGREGWVPERTLSRLGDRSSAP